ncbi:uncharacterized protein TM35_000332220 [Trypanosoma theileri]|uniref:Uncharacterized protein n=1 Tax=Trypanosoma theileri TaxID=67003 RepID=A0A1X0NM21_9TRYP|nr:uncharacterized protein TM35_000332220 [Trypanosoma theileri]ORC85765.1 hypothetical protein TM35_000332220 [Trypanosoma theileri]
MMMMYQPISRKELEKYLPNFDPSCDPQVGEWLLVTPHRRVALVDPLIQISQKEKMRPIYPCSEERGLTVVSPTETLPDTEASTTTRIDDPSRVFPSLEKVRQKYCRHRPHCISKYENIKDDNNNKKDKDDEGKNEMKGNEDDYEADDTILYLNPRALLLTPCAPAVFGGSDFIEGLETETGRVVFVNWRTGEVRTDTAALQPKPTPEWAEGVLEKATVEFESWLRREVSMNERKPEGKEEDRDVPPLQKMRIH